MDNETVGTVSVFTFGIIVGIGIALAALFDSPMPADRMGNARATIAAATQAVAISTLERAASVAATAAASEGGGR